MNSTIGSALVVFFEDTMAKATCVGLGVLRPVIFVFPYMYSPLYFLNGFSTMMQSAVRPLSEAAVDKRVPSGARQHIPTCGEARKITSPTKASARKALVLRYRSLRGPQFMPRPVDSATTKRPTASQSNSNSK